MCRGASLHPYLYTECMNQWRDNIYTHFLGISTFKFFNLSHHRNKNAQKTAMRHHARFFEGLFWGISFIVSRFITWWLSTFLINIWQSNIHWTSQAKVVDLYGDERSTLGLYMKWWCWRSWIEVSEQPWNFHVFNIFGWNWNSNSIYLALKKC